MVDLLNPARAVCAFAVPAVRIGAIRVQGAEVGIIRLVESVGVTGFSHGGNGYGND